MALPAILAGLGSFAQSPLGQSLIGAAVPSAMSGIQNWLRGPQAQDQNPDVALQQYYRQQLRQPFQLGSEQRQQQLMNQFNQQIIPGLAERFSGIGGQRSSAFDQQQRAAGSDLMTNLGALQEENALQEARLNQGRIGELGGYLGGQQKLGLEAQGLGQRGAIAQQENMLRALGLMQGQQKYPLDRQALAGDIGGKAMSAGLGQQYQTVGHAGRQAKIIDALKGAGLGAAQAAQIATSIAML